MARAHPTMLGLAQPEVDVWSERVTTALGMNPGIFTGPGTNTYLVGTGRRRILLDTGQGKPEYVPVLERALERAGCEIQEIVLTHGHVDHIGGATAVIERFGPLHVSKLPWPGEDERYGVAISPIAEGAVVETEGATLRAVHTPGHAPDHLCFRLEEEGALFTGDHVLGVGTTVINPESGSLSDYMRSLEKLEREEPTRIYPAHGPLVADGIGKIREYLVHRRQREAQILAALSPEPTPVPDIVARVYTDVPEVLHRAAALSVTAHLLKLEDERRVVREGDGRPADARWRLA